MAHQLALRAKHASKKQAVQVERFNAAAGYKSDKHYDETLPLGPLLQSLCQSSYECTSIMRKSLCESIKYVTIPQHPIIQDHFIHASTLSSYQLLRMAVLDTIAKWKLNSSLTRISRLFAMACLIERWNSYIELFSGSNAAEVFACDDLDVTNLTTIQLLAIAQCCELEIELGILIGLIDNLQIYETLYKQFQDNMTPEEADFGFKVWEAIYIYRLHSISENSLEKADIYNLYNQFIIRHNRVRTKDFKVHNKLNFEFKIVDLLVGSNYPDFVKQGWKSLFYNLIHHMTPFQLNTRLKEFKASLQFLSHQERVDVINVLWKWYASTSKKPADVPTDEDVMDMIPNGTTNLSDSNGHNSTSPQDTLLDYLFPLYSSLRLTSQLPLPQTLHQSFIDEPLNQSIQHRFTSWYSRLITVDSHEEMMSNEKMWNFFIYLAPESILTQFLNKILDGMDFEAARTCLANLSNQNAHNPSPLIVYNSFEMFMVRFKAMDNPKTAELLGSKEFAHIIQCMPKSVAARQLLHLLEMLDIESSLQKLPAVSPRFEAARYIIDNIWKHILHSSPSNESSLSTPEIHEIALKTCKLRSILHYGPCLSVVQALKKSLETLSYSISLMLTEMPRLEDLEGNWFYLFEFTGDMKLVPDQVLEWIANAAPTRNTTLKPQFFMDLVYLYASLPTEVFHIGESKIFKEEEDPERRQQEVEQQRLRQQGCTLLVEKIQLLDPSPFFAKNLTLASSLLLPFISQHAASKLHILATPNLLGKLHPSRRYIIHEFCQLWLVHPLTHIVTPNIITRTIFWLDCLYLHLSSPYSPLSSLFKSFYGDSLSWSEAVSALMDSPSLEFSWNQHLDVFYYYSIMEFVVEPLCKVIPQEQTSSTVVEYIWKQVKRLISSIQDGYLFNSKERSNLSSIVTPNVIRRLEEIHSVAIHKFPDIASFSNLMDFGSSE